MARLILLGGFAAALVICGVAEASWTTGGSGNGASSALAIPLVSPPAPSITAYPDVSLSWPAVTLGGAAVAYTVRRYSEAGVLQTIGAGCSGPLAASSCTENAVPAGRWQYTAQATKASWTGRESVKSTTVEIAAAPTSVACLNCHTYGTTSYINAANSTTVQLRASFAATSLATDAASLSVTDSANNSVSASSPAPAGAGMVSFAPVSTATLVDGSITAGVHATANTGDVSPTTSLALVRDTAAPSGADIAGTNGGTARHVDDGDTLTFTFSEPVDPGTVETGWTGAPATVSVVLTNAGGHDTIAVTGTNLGSVGAEANYVKATLTCGASTMSMNGSEVQVALGGCAPTTAVQKNSAPSAFVWTPSASVTDLAGNPMSTTPVTETGGSQVNF